MRILGSRGVPARYGGFETLAERLQYEVTINGITCDVIGTRDAQSRESFFGWLVERRPFRNLETPLLTWVNRNRGDAASADRTVLIVNPINVFTAMALQRSGHHVALHMDGMEDQRSKWGRFLRLVHRTVRQIAVRSDLLLLTDSKAIQEWYLATHNRRTEMITYGGCIAAESDNTHRWVLTESSDFFMVVARPEPENQILEICEAFIASGSTHRLVMVGAPIGKTKYWTAVNELVSNHPNIELADSIWDRQQLCDLYLSTLGVIHGHTVGGTNPALVDAVSHGCPVMAHDNAYNREVLQANGSLWNSVDALTEMLRNYEPRQLSIDVDMFLNRYNWKKVAHAYQELLNLRP